VIALPLLLVTIPLGFLIDRHARAPFLVLFGLIEIVALVATSLAPNFTTLVIARCLIGFSAPASTIVVLTMLGDLFSEQARGRATFGVGLGDVLGSSSAFAFGGAALQFVGSGANTWREAAAWVAVPLLFVTAALAFFPKANTRHVPRSSNQEFRAWPILWRYRGVLSIILCARIAAGVADGAAFIWAAPSLARGYSLTSAQVAGLLGAVILACGIIGPAMGGFLTDYAIRAAGPRRAIRLLTIPALLMVPAAFFTMMPSVGLSVASLAVFFVFGFMIETAVSAITPTAIPQEIRGVSISLAQATRTAFGVGLSPLLVSWLAEGLGRPLGLALGIVDSAFAAFAFFALAIGAGLFQAAATTCEPSVVPNQT
jgi:MFS family permease